MNQRGYLPVHQRTTVWYLFNPLFMVRVNARNIRTVEEIKRYGTPSTGNEDYDRENDKNEQVVMWNIATMEKHFAEGYPIKIVQYDDCALIYKHISEHLLAMHATLGGSENVTDNPKTMEELVRLDTFADAVFQHARYNLKNNIQHAGYARRMQERDPFSKLASLVRNKAPVAGPVHVEGSSSVGRQYGTREDLPANAPLPETGPIPLDPPVEDPNLPRRISLGKLFEERRQMGLRHT